MFRVRLGFTEASTIKSRFNKPSTSKSRVNKPSATKRYQKQGLIREFKGVCSKLGFRYVRFQVLGFRMFRV